MVKQRTIDGISGSLEPTQKETIQNFVLIKNNAAKIADNY
jgi:hypothetical protein